MRWAARSSTVARVLVPFTLAFLAFTLLLLARLLWDSAQVIAGQGSSATIVGRFLLLSLPSILVLTLPMALLFAILVSLGRMLVTKEATPKHSSGVGLPARYRSFLRLSLVLTALTMLLMTTVVPRSNAGVRELVSELLDQRASPQIEPRSFYTDWEGLALYVFEVIPEGRWKGVFLAETGLGAEDEITVAEWGEVRMDEERQRMVLHLENAVRHRVDFAKPEEYKLAVHRGLQRVLDHLPQLTGRMTKSLRELRLGELYQVLEEPNIHPARYNLARVEIHKKFSLPVACIVCAVLAVPLGLGSRREGRSASHATSILIGVVSFPISMAIVYAYNMMLSLGEQAALMGKLEPWLAMWRPNMVLTLVFAVVAFLIHKIRRRDVLLAVLATLATLAVGLMATGYQRSQLPLDDTQPKRELGQQLSDQENRERWAPSRWRASEAGILYGWHHFDVRAKRLYGLQVFHFDADFTLRRRLAVATARFDGTLDDGRGGWVVSDGWTRSFVHSRRTLRMRQNYSAFQGPLKLDLPETAVFFESAAH